MLYTERKSYQKELRDFCESFAASYLVTLSPNLEAAHRSSRFIVPVLQDSWQWVRLTFDQGRELLKEFSARLDRRLLGKNWAKAPAAERTNFIAIPEVAPSAGRHYHLLLKPAPQRVGLPGLPQACEESFRTVRPGGSCHVQFLPDAQAQRAAAEYMTKHSYQQETIENFVVASEFFSSSGR